MRFNRIESFDRSDKPGRAGKPDKLLKRLGNSETSVLQLCQRLLGTPVGGFPRHLILLFNLTVTQQLMCFKVRSGLDESEEHSNISTAYNLIHREIFICKGTRKSTLENGSGKVHHYHKPSSSLHILYNVFQTSISLFLLLLSLEYSAPVCP